MNKYGRTARVFIQYEDVFEFTDGYGLIAWSQALAHKDIDSYAEPEGSGLSEVIIPYHAIRYIVGSMTKETVEAPTDSFCGGE